MGTTCIHAVRSWSYHSIHPPDRLRLHCSWWIGERRNNEEESNIKHIVLRHSVGCVDRHWRSIRTICHTIGRYWCKRVHVLYYKPRFNSSPNWIIKNGFLFCSGHSESWFYERFSLQNLIFTILHQIYLSFVNLYIYWLTHLRKTLAASVIKKVKSSKVLTYPALRGVSGVSIQWMDMPRTQTGKIKHHAQQTEKFVPQKRRMHKRLNFKYIYRRDRNSVWCVHKPISRFNWSNASSTLISRNCCLSYIYFC